MPKAPKRARVAPTVTINTGVAPKAHRSYKGQGKRYARILSRAQPWATYGAMRVRRGTPDSIASLGASWATATPEQRAKRKEIGWTGAGMYTGHGGFFDDMRSGWNQVSGRVGAGFKSAARATGFGGAADALDRAEAAGRAMGLGAYETNALVNAGGGAAEGVPEFQQNGASVVISHREYISDVYGTEAGVGFANQSYGLNPGLERSFPWLAQIATNYDEYSIKQLIFTFRSSIAPIGASSSGQVGTIIMATQYNAGEEPFADKESMMQYDGAMSAKVIDGLLSGVECDPSKMSGSVGKFTRSGPPPAGQDIKTYDLGTFNIAVTNIPAAYENQSLGELWVSYTVELRKPKFYNALGFNIPRDVYLAPQGSYGLLPWPEATLTATTPGQSNISLPPPPVTQLRGQQNNINCLPFSVDLGANRLGAGILFPATYAGNVEMIMDFFTSTLQNTAALQKLNLTLNGNVALIYDIPTLIVGPTQEYVGWTASLENDAATCGPSTREVTPVFPATETLEYRWRVQAHVRVGIATNGQENSFIFSLEQAGTPAIGPFQFAVVDVHEYNTIFNQKQNGSNDSIVWVNAADTTVTPF